MQAPRISVQLTAVWNIHILLEHRDDLLHHLELLAVDDVRAFADFLGGVVTLSLQLGSNLLLAALKLSFGSLVKCSLTMLAHFTAVVKATRRECAGRWRCSERSSLASGRDA